MWAVGSGNPTSLPALKHKTLLAVTKIKIDPNIFFRYVKKFSICMKTIEPLLHPHTYLLTDKTEMCTISWFTQKINVEGSSDGEVCFDNAEYRFHQK